MNLQPEPECAGFFCLGCTHCGHVIEMLDWPPYCVFCDLKLKSDVNGAYSLLGGQCPKRINMARKAVGVKISKESK